MSPPLSNQHRLPRRVLLADAERGARPFLAEQLDGVRHEAILLVDGGAPLSPPVNVRIFEEREVARQKRAI